MKPGTAARPETMRNGEPEHVGHPESARWHNPQSNRIKGGGIVVSICSQSVRWFS
jgi:hypothetical protein